MDLSNLKALSYANGFTLWHLSAEQGDDVRAPGYFAPAAHMLSNGDVIVVSAGGGGPDSVKLYAVIANSGGQVTVSAGVNISAAE